MANLKTSIFFIALGMFSLFTLAFGANSWTLSNGGVYWSENNYTISAYPAVSNELIDHFQYVNFSSNNPANIITNLSFVFDAVPLKGDVLLLQNMSHTVSVPYATRENRSYTIYNVSSYTSTVQPCQIGDAENLFKNKVYFSQNGSNESEIIVCFNTYSQTGNDYTIFYEENATAYLSETQWWMDWGSILGSFTYTNISNHSVYTISNVPFSMGTNYQTKFMYSFPVQSSGKFDIYAHAGSPAQVVAGTAPIYVQLDPWYSASYGAKVQVNITGWTCSATYCQFAIPIALNTSKTNGSDIRVVNSAENETLGFWREDGFNYTNASGNLWVNASNASTMIYIYYNASVSDASSVDNTFIFGDDFNLNPLNISKWRRCYAFTSLVNTTNGYLYLNDTGTELNNPCIYSYIFNSSSNNISFNYITKVKSLSTAGTNARAYINFAPLLFDVASNMHVPPNIYFEFDRYDTKYRFSNSTITLTPFGTLITGEQIITLYNITWNNTHISGDYSTINILNGTIYKSSSAKSQNLTASQPAIFATKLAWNDFTNLNYDYMLFTNVNTSTPTFTIGAEQTNTGITVVRDTQSPADITSLNAIGGVNITYNITGSNSTPILFWNFTNQTRACIFFQNGSCVELAQYNVSGTNLTNLTASPIRWNFFLDDNEIYPSTINWASDSMERMAKSFYDLNNLNTEAKIQLLNVSNTTQYGFFEVFIKNDTTTSNPAVIYYCNSSYNNASKVSTSANCVQFGTLNRSSLSHIHHENSTHYAVPFAVNTTSGKIGSVSITSVSYFVVRGSGGGWSIAYISNITRANVAMTSTNEGINWNTLSGTIDSHLHQFSGNETLNYFASVASSDQAWSAQNATNSTVSIDRLELAGISPTSPQVILPVNGYYSGNITANWTASSSPNGYPITNYTVIIYNADYSLNVSKGNTTNLFYILNTSTLNDGTYLFAIYAWDNMSQQSSIAYSDNFTVDNTAPILAYTANSIQNNSITNQTYAYFEINYTEANRNSTLLIDVLNTTIPCYQETANISTVCGGLDGGSYYNYSGVINAYDENWSSSIDMGTKVFLINYSKPINAVSASWIIRVNVFFSPSPANYTISIPASCWNYAPDNILLQIQKNETNVEPLCFNGSAWVNMGTIGGDGTATLYEEAMNWMIYNTTSYAMTCNTINCYYNYTSLSDRNYTAYVSMNDTIGHTTSLGRIYFVIDTIYPNITIQSPIAGKWYNTTNLTLNYTVYDANIDTCEYSPSGGYTIIAGCANITFNISYQGSASVVVRANDSVGQKTTANSGKFYVDSIMPVLAYTNNSVQNNSIINQAYAYFEINYTESYRNTTILKVGNATYNMTCNITHCYYNTTISSGSYTANVSMTDNASNTAILGNINFTVDNTAPTITIQSPSNTTYNRTNISLNYTVVEANIDKCWYSLNGANTTLAGCANTTINASEGSNNLTIYANDTIGNQNSSTVYFTVDNTNPKITIQAPANATYNRTAFDLNYTVNETNVDTCWYILNAGANTTLASCANSTFTAAQGGNLITVYVNDTVGHINSSAVNFFVDTINPAITIQLPANTTYNATTRSLNYTATDTNLDRCWYSLNGGANIILANCTNTTFTAIQGGNNITVYVNDTLDNQNSSIVYFFVDSVFPVLTVQDPQNITYGTTTIPINFTLIDTNVDSCAYSLDGAPYTNLPGCTNTTFTASMGSHNFTMRANDTAGNVNNSGYIYFIVVATPIVAIQAPINNSIGNQTTILLNFTTTNSPTNCWYSLNGGSNTTLSACANVSIPAFTTGNYNITVYANNSAGENHSTVYFTVDTSPPTIVIQYPTTVIYNTVALRMNYTVLDNIAIDKCWYILNGNAPVNLASCINTTFTADEGSNTLEIFANDTAGNSASDLVNFDVDGILPIVIITSPTNTTYTTTSIWLNYTATDTTLDQCWYKVDGGISISLPGCANIVLPVLSSTSHTIFVYANDSANNIGSDTISFTIHTAGPVITIQSPTNSFYPISNGSSLNISISFTAIDSQSSVSSCWYSINGSANVSLLGCANKTLNLSSGVYTLIIYANDTVGNIGLKSVLFTIGGIPTGPTAMFQSIEIVIGNMFMDIFGSVELIGVALLLVFTGMIFVARLREDARLMVFVPATVLTAVFMPSWFSGLLILGTGIVIYLGIHKLANR